MQFIKMGVSFHFIEYLKVLLINLSYNFSFRSVPLLLPFFLHKLSFNNILHAFHYKTATIRYINKLVEMVFVFKWFFVQCSAMSKSLNDFQEHKLNTVDGSRLKKTKNPSRKMSMFVSCWILNFYRIFFSYKNKIDASKKGIQKKLIIDSVCFIFFTNYANKNYIQFENILSRCRIIDSVKKFVVQIL